MYAEISAAITSAKAALNIAKSAHDLSNYNELVAAISEVNTKLMDATAGLPLHRDDHPSFLYRLQLLRENWPQIVSYDPRWNGGRIASELLQTGILTVTPFSSHGLRHT